MESSFDSKNKFSLLKTTHVFHYPEFFKQKNCRDLINYEFILKLIEKINKNFKASFDIKTLNFISSIPLSGGHKNDMIVFYTDFNLTHNRFSKISVHLNPIEISLIPKIIRFLRIKNTELALSNLPNLEFIGIDFYPDRKHSFKIYQTITQLSENINKKMKNLFCQINRFNFGKKILLMEKYNFNNLSPSDKNIYIFYDKKANNYKDLLRLPSLRRYENFLKQIYIYINKFCINWIAFKNGKIEIYFR